MFVTLDPKCNIFGSLILTHVFVNTDFTILTVFPCQIWEVSNVSKNVLIEATTMIAQKNCQNFSPAQKKYIYFQVKNGKKMLEKLAINIFNERQYIYFGKNYLSHHVSLLF